MEENLTCKVFTVFKFIMDVKYFTMNIINPLWPSGHCTQTTQNSKYNKNMAKVDNVFHGSPFTAMAATFYNNCMASPAEHTINVENLLWVKKCILKQNYI